MLSSAFPSASIPSTNSVPAAISSSAAASAYPALTLQADPDSMSHPNRSGEVLPPMSECPAVPVDALENDRDKPREQGSAARFAPTTASKLKNPEQAPSFFLTHHP
jgi:hypothetical protein